MQSGVATRRVLPRGGGEAEEFSQEGNRGHPTGKQSQRQHSVLLKFRRDIVCKSVLLQISSGNISNTNNSCRSNSSSI